MSKTLWENTPSCDFPNTDTRFENNRLRRNFAGDLIEDLASIRTWRTSTIKSTREGKTLGGERKTLREGKTPIRERKTPIREGTTPFQEGETPRKGETPFREGKTPYPIPPLQACETSTFITSALRLVGLEENQADCPPPQIPPTLITKDSWQQRIQPTQPPNSRRLHLALITYSCLPTWCHAFRAVHSLTLLVGNSSLMVPDVDPLSQHCLEQSSYIYR